MDELQATHKPFQFRQGLDIRLLTEKKAARLAQVRYCGDFIFAFDHLEDRESIERGLAIWRKYSTRSTRLYVLCAYDSQDEEDIRSAFERIRILMGYGCLPYIMRFEAYKQSRWQRLYTNIARWCNQPQFFKKKSFRQFCEANQAVHKTKETYCSAMQALVDFETQFPEIAQQYFDLRFEDENMMLRYGRRFSGKPSDEISRGQRESWLSFQEGKLTIGQVLDYYFSKRLDIVWLAHYGQQEMAPLADRLFGILQEASVDEAYASILRCRPEEPITSVNIPQFSNFFEVCKLANTLDGLQEHLTYEAMGIYLDPQARKNSVANKKYGENHGKLASLLDIASVEVCGAKCGCLSTPFTSLFVSLDAAEQGELLAKLAMRIPIIAQLLWKASDGEVSINDHLVVLSESTRMRRMPNIRTLLNHIKAYTEPGSALACAIENVGR